MLSFFVRDLKASCAFFTSQLGFEVAFLYREPPVYGQVQRDQARLKPLKKQPWDARNFIVTDPDGNLILFASPTDR